MRKIVKTFGFLFLFFFFFGFVMDVSAKPRTNMHIEVPSVNETYKDTMVISGWLMTECESPSIYVYIDNQLIEQSLNRFARADVVKSNPGYPKTKSNQSPGFNTRVDVSPYQDGRHILTINVIDSKSGEVLKQYSAFFFVQKYQSILHLETPTKNQQLKGITQISGWLMSDNERASIEYYLNGEKIDLPTQRLEREDVIKGVLGYGGKKTNPTPGFLSLLDLSSYKDGTYFLEMKIVDSKTKEILTADSRNIVLQKYNGHLNLDHPSNQQMVGTTFVLDGWVLTEKEDARLEVYIDNQKTSFPVSRTVREDVHQAMKGSYGGKKTNPTPGFSITVDMQSYQDGYHTIQVRVVHPDTEDVIVADTRDIFYQKYANHINLDHPSEENVIKTSMTIDGWYLTSYQNHLFEIFIDDEFVNNLVQRTEREDVHQAMKGGYGGKELNPTPGFSTTVDMRDYKDGIHTLKVQIRTSDTNEVIGSQTKKFFLRKYDTHLNLDHPSNKVKEWMTVDGWYLSTSSSKHIEIEIDKQNVTNSIHYVEREDVHQAMKGGYGGKKLNPTPGFSTTVDMRDYKDGIHILTVNVIDDRTSEVLESYDKEIQLDKYDAKIHLDSPVPDKIQNRNLSVAGWEVSTSQGETVRILIDGIIQTSDVTYSKREDVIASIDGAFGGKELNPTPGFNTQIDLSSYQDGIHEIRIELIDQQTSDVIESITRTFSLQKYAGLLHLETPQTSMLNENQIFVAGWEMSELDHSYLKIFLDGQEQTTEIVRAERPDVVAGIIGYGGIDVNQTPAFAMNLDISHLGVGKHQLQLKLYSKLNELLDTTEKELFVYRDIYFGIDVSYYQKNINWQAVRNDGIQFALIRAGYRGYGTGQIVEDTAFKKNIQEALQSGIDCGIYFYTQAISEQEAIEEADFVVNKLKEYQVDHQIRLPIVIDTEFTGAMDENGVVLGRADRLTTQQRTTVVKAFLDRIANYGYQPMIYASKSFLYFNLYMSQLSSYDVWLAHYTSSTDPLSNPSDYTGPYQIWQYTTQGTVSGINGVVDKNIAYKKY